MANTFVYTKKAESSSVFDYIEMFSDEIHLARKNPKLMLFLLDEIAKDRFKDPSVFFKTNKQLARYLTQKKAFKFKKRKPFKKIPLLSIYKRNKRFIEKITRKFYWLHPDDALYMYDHISSIAEEAKAKERFSLLKNLKLFSIFEAICAIEESECAHLIKIRPSLTESFFKPECKALKDCPPPVVHNEKERHILFDNLINNAIFIQKNQHAVLVIQPKIKTHS